MRGESGIKYFSSNGKKDVNLQKIVMIQEKAKGLLEILEKGLWEWVWVIGQAVHMNTDAGTDLVVQI